MKKQMVFYGCTDLNDSLFSPNEPNVQVIQKSSIVCMCAGNFDSYMRL